MNDTEEKVLTLAEWESEWESVSSRHDLVAMKALRDVADTYPPDDEEDEDN